MPDTIKDIQQEYNAGEEQKKQKKSMIRRLRREIRELEAQQLYLQARWNALQRKRKEVKPQ